MPDRKHSTLATLGEAILILLLTAIGSILHFKLTSLLQNSDTGLLYLMEDASLLSD